MSHGIVIGVDKGVVGYCSTLGKTWHQLKEYEQIDEAVSVAKAREALGYEVFKLPVARTIPEFLQARFPAGMNGKVVKGMYVLARADNGEVVHNVSVQDDYQVYQNTTFLNVLEAGILASNPNLAIESCGSLFGGRKAFVNILIDRLQVKKDPTETLIRLMYTNAFGGNSISACCHETRVVCNNTHMLAEAQGAANDTLKKFRHTGEVETKVEQYLVDLTKLRAVIKAHEEALNHLATVQMNVKDVDNFLGNLFPVDPKAGKKTASTRTNKQNAVKGLFETADDLQGDIKGTRYSMFQAVTNYSNHQTETESIDSAFVWHNIVSGGNRHQLNQSAFDLLIEDEIPAPRKMELA